MSRVGLGAVVGSLLFVACSAHTEFHPLATPPRALSPVDPASIVVVQAPAHPPGVNIGRLEVATKPHVLGEPHTDETTELLRGVGGEHGCELLVVAPAKTELYATSNGTPLYKTYQQALCYVKE